MKVLARILSLFTLLAVATLYTSCDGGDDPKKTDEEKQLEKLKASTWIVNAVELNEEPRDDFDGISLKFSGTYEEDGTYQYVLTGTRPDPSPWPSNGNWGFGANPITQMIRFDDDPDLGMAYTLTDTQLIIEFTLLPGAGFPGGRVEQVVGDWKFTFDKQ